MESNPSNSATPKAAKYTTKSPKPFLFPNSAQTAVKNTKTMNPDSVVIVEPKEKQLTADDSNQIIKF